MVERRREWVNTPSTAFVWLTSPQLAKVSEATVSRVLNGKPGVAAATRQSVLAAMDQLGYERPRAHGSTTRG